MKFQNIKLANFFAITIIILLMLVNYFSNENIFEHTWLQACFYMLPTIFLVAINNLFLIPKLLDRQRFIVYFSSIFPLIIIAQIVTGYFNFHDYFNLNIGTILFDFSRYFITTTAGFGFIAFMRLAQQQQKNFEQQLLIRQSELNILKKQVNPHFLFNTLNNIYYLCLDNSAQAAKMVEKLSSLMRYTLTNTEKEFTSLEKEHIFIQNYVSLEKSRFKEDAKINYLKKGDFKTTQIAPLILISFVENCFKHCNQIVPEVDIFLEYKPKEILFYCENNINKQPLKSAPSGTGLQNVEKRLAMIYPDAHTLNIEKTETNFKVSLVINL